MKAKLPSRLPVALDQGFDGLYGLELTELTDERVRGRVAVSDEIKQPAGLVHGGVYAAIAESLASYGTASAVVGDDTTWVWEVEMCDDQGHLCVLSRVTIAVRER